MKVAFYAPLKSPHHPIPSGDRQMARLLMSALRHAGHDVRLISEFRSFRPAPHDDVRRDIANSATVEIERLSRLIKSEWQPDVWMTYHLYYKAPDLIGPAISRRFDIPYIVAEASYSRRRDNEGWTVEQSLIAKSVRQAAQVVCFTARDREGLEANIVGLRCVGLRPFIDLEESRRLERPNAVSDPRRLVTVAMMRPGDKLDSYRMLASALTKIASEPWTLTVVGAGAIASEVKGLFAEFKDRRIDWLGELLPPAVQDVLAAGGTYLWPGFGEAYGMAYLEAQAAGMPVVAQSVAGVPEVVRDGVSGLLSPEGDVDVYARNILRLMTDETLHRKMSEAARHFVENECSLPKAAASLNKILEDARGLR